MCSEGRPVHQTNSVCKVTRHRNSIAAFNFLPLSRTMKHFIGYFDLLGYKKFILNNETTEARRRLGHVLRDIEASLGRGEYKGSNGGLLADLKKSTIKCLNISDTIIFWSQDNSEASLQEFLDVCFTLNWRLNTFNFPVRGALIYDELEMIIGNEVSEGGGMYNVNTIYGKGLVNAHEKCENQSWAGCVIDNSLTDFIGEYSDLAALIDPIAVRYLVPYTKVVENQQEEYALRLVKGKLNEVAYVNVKKDIIDIFQRDNKGLNARAEVIMNNTIRFLDKFKSQNAI
jgi:hypothetical protein